MAAFQNRKPKASFTGPQREAPKQVPFNRSSAPSPRQYAKSEFVSKWAQVGNITPSKKLMEGDENYQALVHYFKTVGATFIWSTYFGKGVNDFKIFHKDHILLQFKRFDTDPDYIIGHVSMFLEESNSWQKLGNLKPTKKALESNPDYVELVEHLKTVNYSFNLKIWLKNPEDSLVLEAKEALLVNFQNKEGDKDFIVGNVVIKGK